MRWLLVKDIQILRRSPLLVGLLIAYPVLISVLIGFALSRGPQKPRVAFLNEVPVNQQVIDVGSARIQTSRYQSQLFAAIDPIRVRTRAEAIDRVRSGDALAALIIPADTTARLSSGLGSAQVEVVYNGDALKQSFVRSTIASKLADANAALADTLRTVAQGYVDLLLRGGKIDLPGGSVAVLGLRSSDTILRAVAATLPRGSPQRAALGQVDHFATLAIDNLGLSKQALGTVANPLRVKETLIHGHRTPLDTFAVAIAAAISLMFVCVLLAAGALALERDENTYGRLTRGLVAPATILAEKIVLAAACSFAVTLAMLTGIGAFVHVDWSRFPLWLPALGVSALSFAALGVAIGAVAREVRVASLLAFLLALPLAFLALVPSGAVAPVLYDVIRTVSAVFPFKPSLEAIDAAVNGSEPGLGVSLLHLAAVIAGFAGLARLALRRFV